jgi:hypothetical protein
MTEAAMPPVTAIVNVVFDGQERVEHFRAIPTDATELVGPRDDDRVLVSRRPYARRRSVDGGEGSRRWRNDECRASGRDAASTTVAPMTVTHQT